MYPRISAFSQISFLFRNSQTVCSSIVTGNLILQFPNFVFSVFPLIPRPPATAKYLTHGIRAQNHNSFQTWNITRDRPLGDSTSHRFYRTNLLPRAKSSPSQSHNWIQTSRIGERHSTWTLGKSLPLPFWAKDDEFSGHLPVMPLDCHLFPPSPFLFSLIYFPL